MLGRTFISFLDTRTRSPRVAPLDLYIDADDVSVPEPAAQDGCSGWGSRTHKVACHRFPPHPAAGSKVSSSPAVAFLIPSDGAFTSNPSAELSSSNHRRPAHSHPWSNALLRSSGLLRGLGRPPVLSEIKSRAVAISHSARHARNLNEADCYSIMAPKVQQARSYIRGNVDDRNLNATPQ